MGRTGFVTVMVTNLATSPTTCVTTDVMQAVVIPTCRFKARSAGASEGRGLTIGDKMLDTKTAADETTAAGSDNRASCEICSFNRPGILAVGFSMTEAGIVRVVAGSAAGTAAGTATGKMGIATTGPWTVVCWPASNRETTLSTTDETGGSNPVRPPRRPPSKPSLAGCTVATVDTRRAT